MKRIFKMKNKFDVILIDLDNILYIDADDVWVSFKFKNDPLIPVKINISKFPHGEMERFFNDYETWIESRELKFQGTITTRRAFI